MDRRIVFKQLEEPKTGWEAIASVAERDNRDKTAVAPVASSFPKLYWEREYPDFPELKSEPFVSELQREAIRQQKEAEPQLGHVEPQFLPNPWAIKNATQTGKLAIEDLQKFKEIIRRKPK